MRLELLWNIEKCEINIKYYLFSSSVKFNNESFSLYKLVLVFVLVRSPGLSCDNSPGTNLKPLPEEVIKIVLLEMSARPAEL